MGFCKQTNSITHWYSWQRRRENKQFRKHMKKMFSKFCFHKNFPNLVREVKKIHNFCTFFYLEIWFLLFCCCFIKIVIFVPLEDQVNSKNLTSFCILFLVPLIIFLFVKIYRFVSLSYTFSIFSPMIAISSVFTFVYIDYLLSSAYWNKLGLSNERILGPFHVNVNWCW